MGFFNTTIGNSPEAVLDKLIYRLCIMVIDLHDTEKFKGDQGNVAEIETRRELPNGHFFPLGNGRYT
jgi:hypothetical protein